MLLWLLIALVLDRVLMKMSAFSYRSEFTAGYGTIDCILARQGDKAISNRVLVPFVIGGLEWLIPALKPYRLTALYEPIRIGLLTLALYMVEMVVGRTGAFLIAALLPATFLFDYYDWTVELGAIAAALTGNLQWAIAGSGVMGFARPYTAPLVGVTYLLQTGDWLGAALVFAAAGVAIGSVAIWRGNRWIIGQPTRMFWQNVEDVKNLLINRPFYLSEIFMTLVFSAVVLMLALMGKLGAAWPVPVALVVVTWVLPRAAETRALTACLIWIAIGVMRL